MEDFAAAFVRLEGGMVLDFRIAWAMHVDTPGDSIIMGTEGALRIPSSGVVGGMGSNPLKVYYDVAGAQVETVIPLKQDKTDSFFLKMRDFVDVVKAGGESPVPSREILYNQAIIDGIIRSAEAGREIEIQIPEI